MRRKPEAERCARCTELGLEQWVVEEITYDDEGLGPEHFRTKERAEERIEQWLEDHATELEPA